MTSARIAPFSKVSPDRIVSHVAEQGRRCWRGLSAFAVWFVVEALLPGATLVVLLLWLSQRFVREGFGSMRQHAFVPMTLTASFAGVHRNWWSCRCRGTCARLSSIAYRLRRCCVLVLGNPWSTLPSRERQLVSRTWRRRDGPGSRHGAAPSV